MFLTLFYFVGILSLLFSSQDKVLWTIVGAKDLFNTQGQLDIFTKKYIMEEFEELLAASNYLLIFLCQSAKTVHRNTTRISAFNQID